MSEAKQPIMMSFQERLLLWGATTVGLTVAATAGPFWDLLPDISGIVPSAYQAPLAALPGPTNLWVFAFLNAFIIAAPIILIKRSAPYVASLAATLLWVAAMPFGIIKWFGIGFDPFAVETTPSPLDWLWFLATPAAFAFALLWAQNRRMIKDYRERGVEADELRKVRATWGMHMGFSFAVAATASFVIGLVMQISALPQFTFREHTPLGFAAVGLLLLLSLAALAGVRAKDDAEGEVTKADDGTETSQTG